MNDSSLSCGYLRQVLYCYAHWGCTSSQIPYQLSVLPYIGGHSLDEFQSICSPYMPLGKYDFGLIVGVSARLYWDQFWWFFCYWQHGLYMLWWLFKRLLFSLCRNEPMMVLVFMAKACADQALPPLTAEKPEAATSHAFGYLRGNRLDFCVLCLSRAMVHIKTIKVGVWQGIIISTSESSLLLKASFLKI